MAILTLQQIFPIAQTVTWRVYDEDGYTTAAAPPHSNPMAGVYTATVDVNGTDIGIEWTGNVSGVFRQDFSPLNAVNSAVTELNSTLAQINSTVSSTASQVSTLRVNDIPMPESATESTLRYLRDVAILAQPGGGGGGGTALPVASQAEAEAGVVNNKTSTPLRTTNTIDAKRPFASQTEVDAGAEAAKVASPLTIFVRHGHVDAVEKHLVWDAPQSPARTPKGTKDDPIRVNTAALLDAYWLTRIAAQTAFIYHAGTFETEGWKTAGAKTIRPNHQHFGFGNSSTTIKLVNASSLSEDDGRIFSMSGLTPFDNWEIGYMTLDCNSANLPKQASNKGTSRAIELTGGSNINVHDIDIINFGSFETLECFPCGYQAATVGTHENVQFRNIKVHTAFVGAAGGTCTAIVLGAREDLGATLLNCFVRNCYVNIAANAFASWNGLHSLYAVNNDIYVQGNGVGIYHEPAWQMKMPICAYGNRIRIGENSQGIRIGMTAGGSIDKIIFENNLFLYAASVADTFGIALSGTTGVGRTIAEAVLKENVFLLDTDTTTGDIPGGTVQFDLRADITKLLLHDNVFGNISINQIIVASSQITSASVKGNRKIGGARPVVYDYDSTPAPPNYDANFRTIMVNELAIPDATAENGTLYVSTDKDKQLCFKDDAGTVTQLTFLAP